MFGPPGPSILDPIINNFFMKTTTLADKSWYQFYICCWVFFFAIIIPCLICDYWLLKQEISRFAIYLYFTMFFFIWYYSFIIYLTMIIGEKFLDFPVWLLKIIYIFLNSQIITYFFFTIFYFYGMFNGHFHCFILDWTFHLCFTFLNMCMFLFIIFRIKYGISTWRLLFLYIFLLISFIVFWCMFYWLCVYFPDFASSISHLKIESLGNFNFLHKRSTIYKFTGWILPYYFDHMHDLMYEIYKAICRLFK